MPREAYPMQRSRLTWYLLAALLALVPVVARVMTWKWSWSQAVDPAMAQAGEELFKHEWKPGDPLAAGGDGLGPVFNASSCVACHKEGGVGGAGGLQHNVTTFTVRPVDSTGKPREGVVHARATKYRESLAQVHPALPDISQPPLFMLVD